MRRLAFLLFTLTAIMSPPLHAGELVVLLHGLCRSPRSMAKMEAHLRSEGFEVLNVGYPSRKDPIEKLTEEAIGQALTTPEAVRAERIHFVTHSMGGILVRDYLERHTPDRLGRVVMLGPPNQGSEIVDALGSWRVFGLLNGPAGRQLGTDPGARPLQLGPARFEVGIIAGDRSINWINSCIIPGPDDGKVSVERTRLAGMKDHLVVHATHPFLMRNREVLRQTVHFLRHGSFSRPATP